MPVSHWALMVLMLAPAISSAQSQFNGTWRPNYSPTELGKPVASVLADGSYACQGCDHPYKIKADGRDQPVPGHPYFDTISATIVNPRTLKLVAKKNGRVIANTIVTVSADRARRTEVETIYDEAPVPVEFTSRYKRVGDGPSGSDPISGNWQLTGRELSNHAEDTIYKVRNNVLSMSDRMGRSFTARLDGTQAPYRGDPGFTTVSVKMMDSRTIVETDLKAGHAAKIATWTVSADGKSMHVRFDDTKGHIQEQDGYKVQ